MALRRLLSVRHLRMRRITAGVMWTFLVMGAVAFATGVASCRWRITRRGARSILEIHGGMIEFNWNHRRTDNAPIWRGWSAWNVDPPARWTVGAWTPSSGMNPIGGWRYQFVPIWMVAAPPLTAGAAMAVFIVRRRTRARGGSCIACGYDLRGLARSAPCPECGAKPQS